MSRNPSAGGGAGFEIDPEQIRVHGNKTAGVATSVGYAADAGHHVAALDDAYGWICQGMGLPEMLRGPQQRAAEMISNVQSMLQEDAENLSQAADRFAEIEDQLTQLLTKLVADLDRAGCSIPTVGGN